MERSVGLVCSLLQCLVVLGLPESLPLNGDHSAARDTKGRAPSATAKARESWGSMALLPAT